MHLLSFQTFFLQFSDDEILFDGKGMLIFKIIYSLFNNIFQNYPIPLGGIFDNLGIKCEIRHYGTAFKFFLILFTHKFIDFP